MLIFLVLAVIACIYFAVQHDRKELIKKRSDLLLNLSKTEDSIDSERFIRELRKVDFKLFGGCKTANSYQKCYLCDISGCPRHNSNDEYYNTLNRYPIKYPAPPHY